MYRYTYIYIYIHVYTFIYLFIYIYNLTPDPAGLALCRLWATVVQEDLDVSETHNAELALLAGIFLYFTFIFYISYFKYNISYLINFLTSYTLHPTTYNLHFNSKALTSRRRTTPSSLCLPVRLINPKLATPSSVLDIGSVRGLIEAHSEAW